MVAILVVTISILFKDYDVDDVLASISRANVLYLLGGVAVMLIYQFCIGCSIHILLCAFSGKRLPFEISHKTAYIGFYFNAITPSSSGGQPMEMYYLRRRGIDLSHSTIIFILLAVCYSLSTMLFAALGLLTHFDLIMSSLDFIRYFMIFGFLFTATIVCLMILLLVRPSIIRALAKRLTDLGVALRIIRHPIRILRKVVSYVNSYRTTSTGMWKNPFLLLKLLGLHLIQVFALYTVPWFVSLALGGEPRRFGELFCLQAVLYISSDFFPTPGAVGLTETGFITMFQSVLPSDQIMPAMLLTRTINLYGFLIISALVTAISFFTINRDNRRVAYALDRQKAADENRLPTEEVATPVQHSDREKEP